MAGLWRAFTVEDRPLGVEGNDPGALVEQVFSEHPEIDQLKLGRFSQTAFCYMEWREVRREEGQ